MELKELQDHERRALVGLVHHLIRVDGQLTDEEIDSMSAVAQDLGQEAWREAFRSVLGDAHTEARVLELAQAVTRVAARTAILEILNKVARSDEVDASETAFLERVVESWA